MKYMKGKSYLSQPSPVQPSPKVLCATCTAQLNPAQHMRSSPGSVQVLGLGSKPQITCMHANYGCLGLASLDAPHHPCSLQDLFPAPPPLHWSPVCVRVWRGLSVPLSMGWHPLLPQYFFPDQPSLPLVIRVPMHV